MEELRTAARDDRYFVILLAFDYAAARQRQKKLLWMAKMSTPAVVTNLPAVIPALAASGRPVFGRDTTPDWVDSGKMRDGSVIIAPLEVKETVPDGKKQGQASRGFQRRVAKTRRAERQDSGHAGREAGIGPPRYMIRGHGNSWSEKTENLVDLFPSSNASGGAFPLPGHPGREPNQRAGDRPGNICACRGLEMDYRVAMLPPRVTMQAVARAAGVHQTTVSLALRNNPRLPEKTRRRIQKIADRLGYRPDPMLAALSHYRFGRREVKAPTTLAFLLNFRDQAELKASHPHWLFLEGARRQAERIGYQLEIFYIGHRTAGAGQRIAAVLLARGIVGVILAAFGDRLIRFEMDWDAFSVVRIESQQLESALHTVSSHQTEITREAVRRLHHLGYRRIGLAVGEREETYLRNAFTAGYYVEVSLHAQLGHLPPLLLPFNLDTADMARRLTAWIKTHKIEVIVSNEPEVPEALRGAGWRIPRDIVVASLDLEPGRGVNAGVRQNHRIVGERAVEQLAILLRTNQRGPGRPHSSTFIEGNWVDGSDVPPCRTERKRRAARR